MTLPDILIIDDALPLEELAKWQERVRQLTEHSNPNSAAAMRGEVLLAKARETVGDVELLHAPIFAIAKAQNEPTEMHHDVGEYAVIFYPLDCATGFLRTERGKVAVKANRLVALNVTMIKHQQVTPTDDSVRYSVAMKFNPLRTQTEADAEAAAASADGSLARLTELGAPTAEPTYPDTWIGQ